MISCSLKKQSLLFLFLSLMVCFNLPAMANQRTWYPVIAVAGGLAMTTHSDQRQSFPIVDPITDQFYIYQANNDKNITFFDIFTGVEWRHYAHWSMQMGLAYNQPGEINEKGILTQGADILSQNQFDYGYHITIKQLLAETKFLYNFSGPHMLRCHPYILAGLGVAFNDAENFYTNVPKDLAFTREYQNQSQTSFSYAFGTGIDIDVAKHMRLGFGYRFTDFGRVNLGAATIDGTAVNGSLTRSHIYTNEILAQLTALV